MRPLTFPPSPHYSEAPQQKPLKQFNRTRKSKEQRKKSAQISKDEMKCKSFYFDVGASLDCKSFGGPIPVAISVPGDAFWSRQAFLVSVSSASQELLPTPCSVGSAISVYKLIFTLGHDWHSAPSASLPLWAISSALLFSFWFDFYFLPACLPGGFSANYHHFWRAPKAISAESEFAIKFKFSAVEGGGEWRVGGSIM